MSEKEKPLSIHQKAPQKLIRFSHLLRIIDPTVVAQYFVNLEGTAKCTMSLHILCMLQM